MYLEISLLMSSVFLCTCDVPEVQTPYGIYKGDIIKLNEGRDIIAYRGIPYAQPPVGKLRFKDPVMVEKVLDGRKDVMNNASWGDIVCPQPEASSAMKEGALLMYLGQEDCLYLNIYVPKIESEELLPVYFWIHGGGYMAGSGSYEFSNPGLLLDKDRNMIMVSLNYRLGALGFLSVDDEVLPGNLGMKDQVLALKWINENIISFGGDPNLITIGGLSAGASSVSLHLHSKASKGLFQRAVGHSGTADCLWATKSVKEARGISSKVLSVLGCSESNPHQILDCLQRASYKDILKSVITVGDPLVPFDMVMAPVFEKDSPNAFLTKESFDRGSEVPWLTGITNEEGLIFYTMSSINVPGYTDLSVIKSNSKRLLPAVGYYSGNPNADQITEQLINFYFKDGFSKETAKNYVQLLSDLMFNHGFHTSTKRHKGKLYQYMLSYKGKNTVAPIRPPGTDSLVSHGDDLFYFFPNVQFGGPSLKLSEEDKKISDTMLDMWFNFIKNGDPTPESHTWEESDGARKYLDITNNGLIMSADAFKDRIPLFDYLNKQSIIHEEL